ncbi:MAG: hypothetical protein HY364_03400 [Candidatus Aenigmarchaeota archaeon]|nr:hypothetical protein [Candidatus Aenigmarchaeota archaeon]
MAFVFGRKKLQPHFNILTQAEYAENLEEALANPHQYEDRSSGYMLTELGLWVAERFKDKPVIDLACGSPKSVKRMYRLASVAGTSDYLGTDILATGRGAYKSAVEGVKEGMPMENYPRWDVSDKDMLLFLKGLARNLKGNVLFNGIDDAIIRRDDAGIRYMDEVYLQIKRHLADGGIVIGSGDLHGWLGRFAEHEFERVEDNGPYRNSIGIFMAK